MAIVQRTQFTGAQDNVYADMCTRQAPGCCMLVTTVMEHAQEAPLVILSITMWFNRVTDSSLTAREIRFVFH